MVRVLLFFITCTHDFPLGFSVIGEYRVKLEAQTLKTDSHDIIFGSFFLFLKNTG